MCLGAGLNHVTIALISSVLKIASKTRPLKVASHLTCECVSVLHLCGVRSSVGHKVDIDILANGLMHWPQFSLYEAAICINDKVSRDITL